VKTYLFHANEILGRMIRVMFDEGSGEITSREEGMVANVSFPKETKSYGLKVTPNSAIFGNILFNQLGRDTKMEANEL
jgi:hypothetical protein